MLYHCYKVTLHEISKIIPMSHLLATCVTHTHTVVITVGKGCLTLPCISACTPQGMVQSTPQGMVQRALHNVPLKEEKFLIQQIRDKLNGYSPITTIYHGPITKYLGGYLVKGIR